MLQLLITSIYLYLLITGSSSTCYFLPYQYDFYLKLCFRFDEGELDLSVSRISILFSSLRCAANRGDRRTSTSGVTFSRENWSRAQLRQCLRGFRIGLTLAGPTNSAYSRLVKLDYPHWLDPRSPYERNDVDQVQNSIAAAMIQVRCSFLIYVSPFIAWHWQASKWPKSYHCVHRIVSSSSKCRQNLQISRWLTDCNVCSTCQSIRTATQRRHMCCQMAKRISASYFADANIGADTVVDVTQTRQYGSRRGAACTA